MIYRGTTPTIVLRLTNTDVISFDDLFDCKLTIENDSGRNKKIFTNCVKDPVEKTISTKLTYDDTIGFEKGWLLLQLAAKLPVDDEFVSPIFRMEIGDRL